MAQRTLAEIAFELYSLTPDRFTAARDKAARDVRAHDRDLSDEVKQLRRPSVAAWAVNHLVRERTGDIDDLVSLGARLREAQQALDADELRTMTHRRQQVVGALTDTAESLAEQSGQKLADAVLREVSGTLDAALVDAGAASAVRSGRLMRALEASGFGAVELFGAVAVPEDLPATPAPSTRTPARKRTPAGRGTRQTTAASKASAKASATATAKAKADADAKAKAQRDADIAAAQHEVDQAQADAEAAERAFADAKDAVARIDQELADLQARLDDAGARRSDAERARRDTDAARKAAARARDAAQRRLETARRRSAG